MLAITKQPHDSFSILRIQLITPITHKSLYVIRDLSN